MEETHSRKLELDDHLPLQPVGRGKDEPDLSPTHFVDHAAPLPGWRPTLASPQSTRTRPIGSWTARRRVMRNRPDPQSWDLASGRRGDPQRAGNVPEDKYLRARTGTISRHRTPGHQILPPGEITHGPPGPGSVSEMRPWRRTCEGWLATLESCDEEKGSDEQVEAEVRSTRRLQQGHVAVQWVSTEEVQVAAAASMTEEAW